MKYAAALIVLALATALVPATAMIIVLGILPTLAAALGDNHNDRRKTLAVGLPNFAGILPVLIGLWEGHRGSNGGHGLDAAYALLLQPLTWLLLYGGAALGLAIYSLVPKAIGGFSAVRAGAGIDARRDYQRALELTWGKAVRADTEEKETP